MKTPQDRLWESVWTLGYNAQYSQEAASFMLKRWAKIDFAARCMVAVAAPTSAIAGWALWSSAQGKIVWALIAGFASVLAIFEGVSGAQDRIKKYTELSFLFSRLRHANENLLDDMRLNPDFDLEPIRDAMRNAGISMRIYFLLSQPTSFSFVATKSLFRN